MYEENTPAPPSTAANATLQGLMRRLGGAALDELLPPQGGAGGGGSQPPLSLSSLMEGRSKLKTLLQGLKSDNENQQLESMMELCDYLSMGTEESLAGFSIDSFVPAIVNLLNMEHNPDLMHIFILHYFKPNHFIFSPFISNFYIYTYIFFLSNFTYLFH